jgi:hypothetical protein
MNNFEVNVADVGVNVDLADMKSIDSNNSLFGVTSFDSGVVDNFNRTHDYDCCKGQSTTAITKLQVMLNEVSNNYKASFKMHDDIVHLFDKFISCPFFDKFSTLKTRKAFIQSMEKSFHVTHLRPKHTNVKVHNGLVVTVPVFDAKSMILDILTNPICMEESNFAPGYDVFTGNMDENHDENKRYSEIHTGNAWLPTRDKFCNPNDNGDNMPVGLIVFGDKSHTDLHGMLALTPIIFTLRMFNRASRNNTNFWRPLGYIPNLSYGQNKADRTMTSNKIQDKHNFLSIIFRSLREIHRNGGFSATVMGREVKVKVGFIFSSEILGAITNGLVTIQEIERKFVVRTGIVSVNMIN